ncbi:MAG: hypothetical protein U1F53_09575 [Burkholderiaceae bacterium]
MDARSSPLTLAARAIGTVAPLIEAQLASRAVSGLGVVHLVALDPAQSVAAGALAPHVLCEHSIGPRERWDVDYADFARRKARVSWRHQMDSRRVRQLQPPLLRPDDCLLEGGVWFDGFVVACSPRRPGTNASR